MDEDIKTKVVDLEEARKQKKQAAKCEIEEMEWEDISRDIDKLMARVNELIDRAEIRSHQPTPTKEPMAHDWVQLDLFDGENDDV